MSAQPVDVLAVLDEAWFALGYLPGADAIKARNHVDEARAAVAELIEAAAALQEAMDEPEKGPFDSLTVKRFHEADARHRAALARVQGGQS